MKNPIVRAFLLFSFSVAAVWAGVDPTAAGGDFRTMAPRDVRAILSDQGLQVRRYTAGSGEKIYRGSSVIKPIGKGDPVKNTLTFFLAGESSHVSKLELVLTVNVPDEKASALAEFSSATCELLTYCGDDSHTAEITENIRLAKSGTWSIKRGGIILNRIDRADGVGYEMRVTVL